MRRLLPCGLVAATLAALACSYRTLRSLARLSDQRDPLVLLEHPTGRLGDLLHALARSDAATLLRLAAWFAPALGLGVLAVRARKTLRWRGAAVAFVIVGALLLAWQALADERLALRTLCWAADSGVYDRATRERALARGRTLLASPLGRLSEALGARAGARCAAAATALGLDAAGSAQ